MDKTALLVMMSRMAVRCSVGGELDRTPDHGRRFQVELALDVVHVVSDDIMPPCLALWSVMCATHSLPGCHLLRDLQQVNYHKHRTQVHCKISPDGQGQE